MSILRLPSTIFPSLSENFIWGGGIVNGDCTTKNISFVMMHNVGNAKIQLDSSIKPKRKFLHSPNTNFMGVVKRCNQDRPAIMQVRWHRCQFLTVIIQHTIHSLINEQHDDRFCNKLTHSDICFDYIRHKRRCSICFHVLHIQASFKTHLHLLRHKLKSTGRLTHQGPIN
jgi:hypothetical protein